MTMKARSTRSRSPSRFAVSKFEVTFDEWDACVAYGGCAQHVLTATGGRGTQPVINVSWDDAKHYVAWLSKMTGKPYRLLTEAEWEYAARAGTTTAYSWGDEIGKGNANCNGCGSQWDNTTRPLRSARSRPMQFGLHDMHGNVWEWVEDCYQSNYNGAPTDGSAWTTGDCIAVSSAAVPGSCGRFHRAPVRLPVTTTPKTISELMLASVLRGRLHLEYQRSPAEGRPVGPIGSKWSPLLALFCRVDRASQCPFMTRSRP